MHSYAFDTSDRNQRDAVLARVISDLARGLAANPDRDATLTGIVTAVVAAVPGAAHSGITHVAGRGRMVGRACTDAIAEQLDQLQADLQRGPSIAGLRQHRTISIPEMAGEEGWPDFAAAAVKLGVRSMLSLQLFLGDETLGALNLYATTPRGFTADDQTLAEAFAAHAAIALRDAAERQQFSQAIASRDVIGQAKGILMERNHTTATRAFDMLVAASQQTNLKLIDVARRLVDQHEPHPTVGRPPSGALSVVAGGAVGLAPAGAVSYR